MRSLQQSVLRWPKPEQVLAEAETWAVAQRESHPDLDASVGSDIDLLLVDESATGSQSERLRHWPLEQLPLSCDALVLTSVELESLLASDSRMAQELKGDLRWIL